MGEYAKYGGTEIKVGTCEDMYYLRYDQRGQVYPVRGSVNPAGPERYMLRFRFPWPDEDHVPPGGYDPYDRALAVPGFAPSQECEHRDVQFTARVGYVTSLPCPEGSPLYHREVQYGSTVFRLGTLEPPIHVHRNGFQGATLLQAQKLVKGIGLVPILRCGGCGSMWREEDRERIAALAVCLRVEGDLRERHDPGRGAFWHTIADRVLEGLTVEGTPLHAIA